jgi:hypothetical protein
MVTLNMNILNQVLSSKQLTNKLASNSEKNISSSLDNAAVKQLNNMTSNISDRTQESVKSSNSINFLETLNNFLGQATDVKEVVSTAKNVIQNIDNEKANSKNTQLSMLGFLQNTESFSAEQNSLLSTLGLSALGANEGELLAQIISKSKSEPAASSQERLQNNLQTSSSTASKPIKETKNTDSTHNVTNTNLGKKANLIESENSILPESSLLAQVEKFSFGEDGLDIMDGFDTVNVLHHIPVVSTIYQEVTGDKLNAVAKLGGGFIYGGALGLALSAADLAVEYVTGSSVAETVSNFDYGKLFFDATNNKNSINDIPAIIESVASY